MVIFEDKYRILELMMAKDLEEDFSYIDAKDRIEAYKDPGISNKQLKKQSKDEPPLRAMDR